MLNPKGRTPYPEWAAPYTAVWHGQWIVVFPDEASARDGLKEMRENEDAPALAPAPLPDSEIYWYVGVVD